MIHQLLLHSNAATIILDGANAFHQNPSTAQEMHSLAIVEGEQSRRSEMQGSDWMLKLLCLAQIEDTTTVNAMTPNTGHQSGRVGIRKDDGSRHVAQQDVGSHKLSSCHCMYASGHTICRLAWLFAALCLPAGLWVIFAGWTLCLLSLHSSFACLRLGLCLWLAGCFLLLGPAVILLIGCCSILLLLVLAVVALGQALFMLFNELQPT